MNPYGAVPAALEQTRLSLRDIMAGFVSQKIQESKLSLANKQMDMEARALELDAEKQKAKTAFDLARVARETTSQDRLYEQSQARTNLAQKKLDVDKEVRLARIPIESQKADTEAARQRNADLKNRILRDEQLRMNETKTVDEWAKTAGFGSMRRKVWNSNVMFPDGPETQLTYKQLKDAEAELNKNPVNYYKDYSAQKTDELIEMDKLLKDKTLPSEKREALTKSYNALYRDVAQVQRGINDIYRGKTKFTRQDMEDLRADASYTWKDTLTDKQREAFPGGMQAYIKKYEDDYMQRITQAVNYLDSLRKPGDKKSTGITVDITPEKKDVKSKNWLGHKDTLWLNDQLNQVEKVKGKAKADEARVKVKEILKTQGLQGAKAYVTQLLSDKEAMSKMIGTPIPDASTPSYDFKKKLGEMNKQAREQSKESFPYFNYN